MLPGHSRLDLPKRGRGFINGTDLILVALTSLALGLFVWFPSGSL